MKFSLLTKLTAIALLSVFGLTSSVSALTFDATQSNAAANMHSELDKLEEESWTWGDFATSVGTGAIGGAIGGAAGGAAAGALAGGVGAGPGALAGGLAGGVAGAVGGAVTYGWNQLFGATSANNIVGLPATAFDN